MSVVFYKVVYAYDSNRSSYVRIKQDGSTDNLKSADVPTKVATQNTPYQNGRPTPQQSEIDVGSDLGNTTRPQVSYKDGKEVPYGTEGSVRPDWCIGTSCSVEVKNYNIANNSSGLVNNITEQAIYRQDHLPEGMTQTVTIDIRGQNVSDELQRQIQADIFKKSNGIISLDDIKFKEK